MIARRQYGKAARIIRSELANKPDSIQLRRSLAEVLLLEKKTHEALRILGRLADELIAAGFEKKAIAVLTKMYRIDPEREMIVRKLEYLFELQERRVWGFTSPAPLAA